MLNCPIWELKREHLGGACGSGSTRSPIGPRNSTEKVSSVSSTRGESYI